MVMTIQAKIFQIVILLTFISAATEGFAQVWSGTASSDWNNPTNWNSASIPNGPGATAYFDLFATPPNQPALQQGRTLTSVHYNGRIPVSIGSSTNTLTFDPNTSSTTSSVNCSGPGGFLYLNSLYFDCNVIFGGSDGTNSIVGNKQAVFGWTVTVN